MMITQLDILHKFPPTLICIGISLICVYLSYFVLEMLPTVSVAHFLESRGMIEDALEIATDPDYRFELAIQLGRLEIAKVILNL